MVSTLNSRSHTSHLFLVTSLAKNDTLVGLFLLAFHHGDKYVIVPSIDRTYHVPLLKGSLDLRSKVLFSCEVECYYLGPDRTQPQGYKL